jgi:diamine N-acetyltransferase
MKTQAHAIHLRQAGPTDALEFATLAEALFRDAFENVNDIVQINAYCAEHYSEAIQRRELEAPYMSVHFVEVAGSVAGYIQMEVIDDVVLLHRFYVDRPWHGSGIAQQMMEFCAGFARAAGARCIRLATWIENRRAVAFYRSAGFVIVGEQPFILGTEIQDDYLLERAIAQP